jgi:DNA-binding response OmpR family regulator
MAEPVTILLVEDDPTLAMGLELNLASEGYRVLVARDGHSGLREALEQQPDLILLDLMLPGLDGFEVLARIREQGRHMPVVLLTARGEMDDKVRGLGVGADDYVTKPFSMRELSARIHAALRRARLVSKAGRRVRFGDVEVDLDARRVLRAEREVALTAREFDLLAWLAEHHGRVQPRERLLAAVWRIDYEGTERTIDNFIRSLRVKLEVDPKNPRHIVTVRGAGYRLDVE